MWVVMPTDFSKAAEAGKREYLKILAQSLKKELNAESDEQQNPQRQLVELVLPKFNIECSYDLSKLMKRLGVASAFGSDADFSALSDTPTFISDMRHSCVIKVDEQGTEAAAASSALGGLAISKPAKAAEFVVDRPFVFAIVDVPTRLVVVQGFVMEP